MHHNRDNKRAGYTVVIFISLSGIICCFPLFPAPPRVALTLYSDEEVRAALEPLRTIPAFTELLLTDPPAAPKQKRTEASEDPQPQPDQPARKETGVSELSAAETKPTGSGILPTPVAPVEKGGQEADKGSASSSGTKPKRKPKGSATAASALGKSKFLGKPPCPHPEPSAASLLPPLPDVLAMFMGCDTPDQFSSLLEYLQLNGGWFPFHVQRRGACQFAAFRRGLDCPMEYTNTHLWRQLVMEMINHKEFFLPQLSPAISGGYGGKLSAEEYLR